MEHCNIAVLGIGGVGGYLAGMLAHTYPNVSFVARGARKAALESLTACAVEAVSGMEASKEESRWT